MEQAFEPLVVTPALRPTLRNQEPIVVVQNHVGLYEGNRKDPHHNDGSLYLTPLRLLYVDRVNPHTRSLSLDLAQVKTAVAQAGFLTSSPKAVLTLRPKSMTAGDAPLSTATTSSIDWQCRICRHDNSGAAVKCTLCGVTRPPIAAGDPSAPLTALACPACTFHNHLSMRDCELCGSPLRPAFGPPPTAPPASISPLPSDLLVKLSFRGGGSTSFFTALQTALREAAWARRPDPAPLPAAPTPTRAVGGISQIVSRVDASHRATDDTLTAAFQDLDALQAMAHEMVRLAGTLATKAGPASAPTDGSDTGNLKHWLFSLGIDSPVTKDTAGAAYHSELAKELEEFLDPVLARVGGILALVDVYCLFNRARGVALVSPEDIYKACTLFDTQGLSLRLRPFSSGLLAVQSIDLSDAVVAQRFCQYLQTFGAMTAVELASYEQMATPLVHELLLIVEERGDICRDDSLEGLKFYPNRFPEMALDGAV